MPCVITYTPSTAGEDFYGEGAAAKVRSLARSSASKAGAAATMIAAYPRPGGRPRRRRDPVLALCRRRERARRACRGCAAPHLPNAQTLGLLSLPHPNVPFHVILPRSATPNPCPKASFSMHPPKTFSDEHASVFSCIFMRLAGSSLTPSAPRRFERLTRPGLYTVQ